MINHTKILLIFIAVVIIFGTSPKCNAYVPEESRAITSSGIMNNYDIVYSSDVKDIDEGFCFYFDSNGVIVYAKPDMAYTDDNFYFEATQ